MPIPLPQLDDRRYADLVEEARALIPSLYPEWTDHNPTDPGIVLVELMAWYTEMVMYHANQVTDANIECFLRLLNGPEWSLARGLEQAIRQSVLDLRAYYRSVSGDDYEWMVTQVWPETPDGKRLEDSGGGRVRRARYLPQRNLTAVDPAERIAQAPAHISLVVVPDSPAERPQLTDELREALWQYLDQRRLLTVRHHVVGPEFLHVSLTAHLFLLEDAGAQAVRERARAAIESFFHPLTGGTDHRGWPFGRGVYMSDVYGILENVVGVDFVTDVVLASPDATREQRAADGSLIGITLVPHELVEIDVSPDSFAAN